jgi:hypothetical protein
MSTLQQTTCLLLLRVLGMDGLVGRAEPSQVLDEMRSFVSCSSRCTWWPLSLLSCSWLGGCCECALCYFPCGR